ncbi:hypothetical protein MMC13_003375 [Lambiella insularis]|nr:hypothetical protein [Lambiella insularis]
MIGQPSIGEWAGTGADPTARSDAKSELAKKWMEIAASHRNVKVVRLLLEHPFYGTTWKRRHRIDGESGVWVTPRAIKSAAGADFETMKLLIERGKYPTEDSDGRTKGEPLNEEEKQAVIDATPTAAQAGDLEFLKLLLTYQYATNKDGSLLPFEVPEIYHKPFIYGAYEAVIHNKPEKFKFLNSFGLKEHE